MAKIHYVSSCLAKHTFSDQWLTITGRSSCVCVKYVCMWRHSNFCYFPRSVFFFHFYNACYNVYKSSALKSRSSKEVFCLCRMIYLLAVEFVGDDDTINKIHKFHGIYTSKCFFDREMILEFVLRYKCASCFFTYPHEKWYSPPRKLNSFSFQIVSFFFLMLFILPLDHFYSVVSGMQKNCIFNANKNCS